MSDGLRNGRMPWPWLRGLLVIYVVGALSAGLVFAVLVVALHFIGKYW